MKRKIILFTFILTTLLLGGCTRKNAENTENLSVSESATPSASGTSQSTEQSQSHTTQTENGTMISEENARKIALSHAGLTAEQVTFIKSGIDRDNGRKNYDIEFYTHDQKEYDYEIDPYSGEVLDYDYDAEYYMPSSETSEVREITADAAKQIALEQVPGAAAQHIREFESDYDNGKLQYEGKIYYEQTEYEFEIDGHNGEILEWDVEPICGNISS